MSDVQKSKKQLQDDLKHLVADTRELLGSTADVSDKAAKSARAKVEEQLHMLDQHVRANPYTTMGISVGVGVLLGLIIGRK